MKKNLMFLFLVAVLPLALVGCHDVQGGLVPGNYDIEIIGTANNREYFEGETIYVPVYSSLFNSQSALNYKLTATLSIHNIDPDNSIEVFKADYYDTNGDLVQAYLDDILVLEPLEVAQIVLQEENDGGTGAKFIVEWVSETDVVSPIVEAVMVTIKGGQGISFISPGRVIKQFE